MENNAITPHNLWKRMLEEKHLLGFDHGFTIPFLIGAYYKRGFLKDEELQTSQCMRFVLTTIYNTTQQGKEVVIFKCGSHEKLVLQYVIDGKRTQQQIESIKKDNLNINHIIYLDFDVFRHAYTLETLVDELWNRYKKSIMNHNFSYRKDGWTALDPKESDFIKNIQ